MDPTDTPFGMDLGEDVPLFQDDEEVFAEDHPMAQLLQEFEEAGLLEPHSGDIRQGVIVEKRSSELLVDIGYKSEGIVTSRELDRLGPEEVAKLSVGDVVPVYILREDREGNVLLSIARARAEEDWKRAEALLESQETFVGTVSGYNRGGVIIRIGLVRGFVPASQLASESQAQQLTDVDQEERWARLMGKEMRVKVIDLDRKRNRLILSERLAMREFRRQQKEKLLEELEEGAIMEGVVSSLADFGAFVNLGGADGLVHLSELSWERISHPSEVVEIGQKVQVQVISVDRERKRIGLSLRRLQPEPWTVVAEQYQVGQIVRGIITKLVNFGAFARLVDVPVEGLIHISELSHQRISHPKEVVSPGEEHELRIIRIEPERKRLGLSLKQALPEEETVEVDWEPVPLEESGVAEPTSATEEMEPESPGGPAPLPETEEEPVAG